MASTAGSLICTCLCYWDTLLPVPSSDWFSTRASSNLSSQPLGIRNSTEAEPGNLWLLPVGLTHHVLGKLVGISPIPHSPIAFSRNIESQEFFPCQSRLISAPCLACCPLYLALTGILIISEKQKQPLCLLKLTCCDPATLFLYPLELQAVDTRCTCFSFLRAHLLPGPTSWFQKALSPPPGLPTP